MFEHLRCTGESVTRFAYGDVEDEFLDAQLPHGVAALVALVVRLCHGQLPARCFEDMRMKIIVTIVRWWGRREGVVKVICRECSRSKFMFEISKVGVRVPRPSEIHARTILEL